VAPDPAPNRSHVGHFAVLLLVFGTGCFHFQESTSPRTAKPLPADVAGDLKRAPSAPPQLLGWQCVTRANYQLSQVTLSVPVFDATTNKSLKLEYYLPPHSNPIPVILILPISAGTQYPLERLFARYFARHGMAAVITLRESEHDPETAEPINAMMRQSILDSARVVDWLETRPELDRNRIGLLGTSMGAIKAAMFGPVEPRIRATALGLVGGDLPFILAYSTDGAWRGGGISRRREAYLHKNHMTREEFRKELEPMLRYDPSTFAPSMDRNKVLLLLGKCDTVVPFKKGWELRAAMGKPETIVLLSGHYSSMFYFAYIRSQVLKFFQRKFAE